MYDIEMVRLGEILHQDYMHCNRGFTSQGNLGNLGAIYHMISHVVNRPCSEFSCNILLTDLFKEDVLGDLPMVDMSMHVTTFLEAAHGQGIPGGFLRPVLNHTQLCGHSGVPELRWHRQVREPPIL